MGQGWETHEKMCEVRQVDFEAGQYAFVANGSLGAESPCNGGFGGSGDMESSRRDREQRKQLNAEGEAVFDHDNRPLTPKCLSCCTNPMQPHQAMAFVLGKHTRIRPKIGKVWTNIATAMMTRSPVVRWRYVRRHLSAVIVTLLQHNWIPIRHTSGKDSEGNIWSLNSARVGIDDWGCWQACRASIEGQLWEKAARHELIGRRLGGRGRPHHAIEACSWQRQLRCAGRRSDAIETGWWSRRCARGPKRARTCIIVFGSAERMQVRSLTRHSISFTKPPKPNTLWIASGSGGGATLLDVARHKSWNLATIWKWRIGRSLYIHLWRRPGNAQRPTSQARGMGCSHHPGHVKLSRKNLGMLEAAQREAHEQP